MNFEENIPDGFDESLRAIVRGITAKRTLPPVVRTGIVGLDTALGGGLSVGLNLLYGPPSCGLTGLAAAFVVDAQLRGLEVAWVAGERSDPAYLGACGVALDRLVVVHTRDPANLSSVLPRHALVIIDRIDSFFRDVEDPCERNEKRAAALSSLSCSSRKTAIVALAQVRYGNDNRLRSTLRQFEDTCECVVSVRRTTGGFSEFDQTLEVTRCVRVAPPYGRVQVRFVKGLGVDVPRHLLERATQLGVVTSKGNGRYVYEGVALGRSTDEAASALQDPDLFERVYAACS